MLAGKKAFGEKVARSLEINLGLPYRSLDQPDDNDTDTAGVVAGYQSGGDDKRTAMKDIADLPEEVSSALRPIIDALKAKYGKT